MYAYADDPEHAERLKGYVRMYWFHPATPVASNANRPDRGLPISCYTNEVADTKKGIFDIWHENNWLGSYGGGIGTSWSKVREQGAKVGSNGKSSGVIPFLKVSDSSTLAVSQGGLRRASQAAYLDVSHPEIEEFIDLRRPTGDTNRRSPELHHGVVIPDAFMEAVEARGSWDLISPKTGEVVKTVDAFDLFKKILVTRVETGEPYILFKDTANRARPEEYKNSMRSIKTSNLCSEIMLHTDELRTGVCCLSSINLEYYDEWKDDEQFFYDIHLFLDNVLEDFINLTKGKEGFEKARRTAMEERSIGIGVMGYHSMLQKNGLPYDSLSAKYLTANVFSKISEKFKETNKKLAFIKGTAPLSDTKRNVHVTAVAPTASIGKLCGLTSPGIDPRISNIYTDKSKIGTYTIKNKYLEQALEEYGMNTDEVWRSIIEHEGSVQHLDLPENVKDVFKTAYEINPHYIIENVSKMTPNIDQGISTNLFIPADIDVYTLYKLHMDAWKKGLKSLYYVRSKAIQRASTGNIGRVNLIELEKDACVSCA
jgi:ribonucleoside-diphosphate reductase alpha chain